jgi:uncharacterized protein (DUF1697 family)
MTPRTGLRFQSVSSIAPRLVEDRARLWGLYAQMDELNIFIALFRGINVGGKNILPMKELASILKGLECEDVRTYIQSGNAVFRHARSTAPDLAARIGAAVQASRGFEPAVLLVTAETLERAVRSNPFPEGEADPSKFIVFFLAAVPSSPDLDAIESVRIAGERFALVGDVAYLYAPDGIAGSKVASRAERALGVAATARNWRSVNNLLKMAGEVR